MLAYLSRKIYLCNAITCWRKRGEQQTNGRKNEHFSAVAIDEQEKLPIVSTTTSASERKPIEEDDDDDDEERIDGEQTTVNGKVIN